MIQDTRTCFHQNRSLNKQNNNKASLIFDWPVLFVKIFKKFLSVCLSLHPLPYLCIYMLHFSVVWFQVVNTFLHLTILIFGECRAVVQWNKIYCLEFNSTVHFNPLLLNLPYINMWLCVFSNDVHSSKTLLNACQSYICCTTFALV